MIYTESDAPAVNSIAMQQLLTIHTIIIICS